METGRDNLSSRYVLLNAQPLGAPLSGIGRYTSELIKALLHTTEMELLGVTSRGVSSFKNESYIRTPVAEALLTKVIKKVPHSYDLRSWRSKRVVSNFRKLNKSKIIYHDVAGAQNVPAERRVVTIHDLSVLKFPQYHPSARVRWVERFLQKELPLFDKVITPSACVRRDVINDLGIEPSKVVVTPLGSTLNCKFSPVNLARPLNKFGLTQNGYFLIAGTIEPRKNISGMVKAYSNLPKAIKDIYPLVCVGGVGWRSEKELNAISHADNVRYLGRVDDFQMTGLLWGAKALLFASFYEGFGLPALEAATLGTRVITSEGSPMAEILQEDASIVSPDNLGQITEAIRNETDSFIEIKQSYSAYNWQACAETTAAVYSDLCRE